MASHPVPRAPDAISEDEKNCFKFMKMIHHTACSVLYTVFIWGTQQGPAQTVEDYLLNTRKCSKGDYKKFFDGYQIKLMSDKSNEKKFDVSTLAKVIRHTCAKVNSSKSGWETNDNSRLEWLVTRIKDTRNEVSHEFKGITMNDLFTRSEDLMNLLKKTLKVAGNLYNEDPADEKQRIQESIENIRDQSLADSDITDYKNIKWKERLKFILKTEGRKELEKRYQRLCHLNPIDFLEDKGVLLDVNMVFTQIEVEDAGHKAKGLQVLCHELLRFCRTYSAPKSGGSSLNPEAYILEGPAGAGKTTLIKYIKAGWSNRSNMDAYMQDLGDFDLLLFMECRNKSISSFSQLLGHLLRETNSKYFREGELLQITSDLKTLILVDGLDELNPSSEKLFRDIIEQDNENFVIFCTSRPEKIRYFKREVPTTYLTAHLKIIGIADDKREEFIRKYHGEMQKQGRSKRDTDSLISYIKRSESHLQSHYRLPLNLVLLTWLWADDPDSVTPMTTSSELYIKTHNLMKKKLLDRLARHEGAQVDDDDLWESIQKVTSCIYKEALDSLSKDAIENLQPLSVQQIKATCRANKLPEKETLSAFFVVRIVEGELKVSVPHKMLYDFYAAQYVVQYLFSENQATTTAPRPGSLKALIREKCSRNFLKMNKFQTMLLQVAGIMYSLHEQDVKAWIAEEIVDLLKDSELGVDDNNQWFELIQLTKNDKSVIHFASNHINKAITITEDRVAAAADVLLKARPKKVALAITSKAKAVPSLESLMKGIADCECIVNLAFWQDFSNPDSSPSNDQELRIVSKRCMLDTVVCHISGDVLAELRGPFTFLSLAVTSDQAAQEVMASLTKHNPDLTLVGLCLHLTLNVSPGVLSKVEGISLLCLVISNVQDDNIDTVCEMAKAILPRNVMLLDMRLPRASVTYTGLVRLLKTMKAAGISSGHISIPDVIKLEDHELEWLSDFVFSELPVRGAIRKLSEKQMWGSPFATVFEE